MAPTREGIVGLVAPVVERAGLDLEDLVITPAGKRRMVRVVVDGDDGVDLDVAASISHEVAEVLDESTLMGEMPYVLEVTSPGVDRPLTAPRHWRRAKGRLVEVTPHQSKPFTGRVVAAEDAESGAVTFDVAGAEQVVPYSEIARARVEIEFSRAKGSEPDSGDDGDENDEVE